MAALDSCVSTAKDTVHLLSRAMQYEYGTPWQNMIGTCATTMICTHIWRCSLFLCFKGFYSEALVCVQVSHAIGDIREVNIACGRNLYGFLRMLVEKLEGGVALEEDEGMMALVSGDVQGSTESSWVWTGSETGQALNHGSPDQDSFAANSKDSSHTNGHSEFSTTLSREEATDWGGWPQLERILQELAQNKTTREQHPQHLAPGSWNGSGRPASASSAASSRISIANII